MKYNEKAKMVKWAVEKYAGTLTDKKIAERLGVSVECITKARQRLGIVKAGYRHKPRAGGE